MDFLITTYNPLLYSHCLHSQVVLNVIEGNVHAPPLSPLFRPLSLEKFQKERGFPGSPNVKGCQLSIGVLLGHWREGERDWIGGTLYMCNSGCGECSVFPQMEI
jgi:hypothetical protein